MNARGNYQAESTVHNRCDLVYKLTGGHRPRFSQQALAAIENLYADKRFFYSRRMREECQPKGESLIRKRVRTCSESNSIAPRLAIGSAWARYFIASTKSLWPST